MKASTYNHIKEDLGKFYNLLSVIVKYWEKVFPGYIMVSVLVQNMAFRSASPQEEDIKEMEEILNILKALKEYNHTYFYDWVYEEVYSIYEVNIMAEMEEDCAPANNEEHLPSYLLE
jgi:hypothetical protein